MAYNVKTVLHLAGILLAMSLLVWCAINTTFYATMLTLSLVLVLVLLLQIAALLRHVSTTNRELARFLSAVKYADFSQSFRGQRSHPSFLELGEAFEGVIDRLRRERGDREEQAVYLQAFVQQLPIAVFALGEDGRIIVANQAFQKFMGGRDCRQLRQISDADPVLGSFLESLRPGREQMLRLKRSYGSLHLKISCTLLRMRGRQEKLVSLQDISGDLESQELEAWHNLIRVMTHEIMNSITPIMTLADTAHQYIGEARDRLADDEAHSADIGGLLDDAANAATTIGKRGQGLLRFVQSYRTLSRLPSPRPRTFRVQELLQEVASLMQEQADRQSCVIEVVCKPQTLELHADPELLEQALINLVRNALDALAGRPAPRVLLCGELRDRGQIALSVTDNGCGMEEESIHNIFVPFYTTKRGGTGIGMTLVKQIVTHNGGTIRVDSRPGKGTVMELLFQPR